MTLHDSAISQSFSASVKTAGIDHIAVITDTIKLGKTVPDVLNLSPFYQLSNSEGEILFVTIEIRARLLPIVKISLFNLRNG